MMIDVTVKTLDSNVYQFSVSDELTVREFKEHIATEVHVPWDKQRIIFCGKVLQDERKLSECNVNGKTVHLVQRLPNISGNQTNSSGASTSNQQMPQTGNTRSAHFHFPMLGRGTGNVFVEAIAMPHETMTGNGDNIGQVIRQMVTSMGNLIPGATLRFPEGSQVATTTDGASPPSDTQAVQNRLITIRSLLRIAFNGINALEGQPAEVYPVQNQDGSQSTQSTESQDSQEGQPETPRDPSRPFSSLTVQEIQAAPRTLAVVYDELDHLQQRLLPFLGRYRELLTSENITSEQLNEETTRRLTNRVSEVTHSVSHINHLLSDLDIDAREPQNLVVRSGVGPLAFQVNVNSVSLDIPDLHTAATAAAAAAAAVGSLANQVPPSTEGRPATQTSNEPTTAVANQTTTQQSTGQQPNSEQPTQQQRFAFLYPPRFVRQVSNAALRSISRIPSATAPSREETTASNTTTGTTDTPTTAGANMNRGSQAQPIPIRPAAFTNLTPSNISLRPSPLIREVLDPFLICDSPWYSRRAERTVSSATTQTSETAPPNSSQEGSPQGDASRNFENSSRVPASLLEMLSSVPLSFSLNTNGEDQNDNVFLIDLLSIFASQFTSEDFLQVYIQGNVTSLNRIRELLREQINTNLLNGEPYSSETLQTNVDRVVTESLNVIQNGTREATILPEIDLLATIAAFLKDHLFKIFQLILTAPETADFANQLLAVTTETIRSAIALFSLCCVDATTSVERVLSARMATDGQIISELMRTFGRGVVEEHGGNVRQYIVRRQPDVRGPEQMDVDHEETVRPAVRATLTTTTNGVANIPESAINATTALEALRAAVPTVTSSTSSQWMADVPVGWGPIIARDVAAQTGQQRPLSDAYLDGMPSKRRRLMKQGNPNRLSNVTASLQEAIQRAGVRPRTSSDALHADLDTNRMILQTALQRSIRDRLARRLTEDRDFDGDKFPQAKRMAE